jgi:hypothetical protein
MHPLTERFAFDQVGFSRRPIASHQRSAALSKPTPSWGSSRESLHLSRVLAHTHFRDSFPASISIGRLSDSFEQGRTAIKFGSNEVPSCGKTQSATQYRPTSSLRSVCSENMEKLV